MARSTMCINILSNLRNYRYYNKLYCQNSYRIISSPVIPNNSFKSNYIHTQLYRFQQHQSANVKDSKSNKDEIKKVSPEEVVNPVTPGTVTMKEKLKKAVKEYGSTVLVFHIGISLISLGGCYLVVSTGIDVSSLLETVGVEKFVTKEVASSAGTFAIAYAIHKVFAPVRITITLASVPFIVRYLRRIGFLKK